MLIDGLTDSLSPYYDVVALDDDALDLMILTRALSKTPYRIKCFEQPDEAMTFLMSMQPRLLIVDYRMPCTDGIDFIKKLFSSVKLGATQIYLYSGSLLPEATNIEVRDLGAQLVLKDDMCSKGYLENLITGIINNQSNGSVRKFSG